MLMFIILIHAETQILHIFVHQCFSVVFPDFENTFAHYNVPLDGTSVCTVTYQLYGNKC